MYILIPIPIGTKHVAHVHGAVWKRVSCAGCQHPYAYLLELEATGEDHDLLFLDGKNSTDRARAHAQHNLLQKAQNCVRPVPCPQCGHYQEDMAKLLKEQAHVNAYQVVGAVLLLSAFVPFAVSHPVVWALAAVLSLIGLPLLIYGYVVSFRFDPNAENPQARIALGQQYAIWGERLAEVLESNVNPGA